MPAWSWLPSLRSVAICMYWGESYAMIHSFHEDVQGFPRAKTRSIRRVTSPDAQYTAFFDARLIDSYYFYITMSEKTHQ